MDALKLSQQGKQQIMVTLGIIGCSEWADADDVAAAPCQKFF